MCKGFCAFSTCFIILFGQFSSVCEFLYCCNNLEELYFSDKNLIWRIHNNMNHILLSSYSVWKRIIIIMIMKLLILGKWVDTSEKESLELWNGLHKFTHKSPGSLIEISLGPWIIPVLFRWAIFRIKALSDFSRWFNKS